MFTLSHRNLRNWQLFPVFREHRRDVQRVTKSKCKFYFFFTHIHIHTHSLTKEVKTTDPQWRYRPLHSAKLQYDAEDAYNYKYYHEIFHQTFLHFLYFASPLYAILSISLSSIPCYVVIVYYPRLHTFLYYFVSPSFTPFFPLSSLPTSSPFFLLPSFLTPSTPLLPSFLLSLTPFFLPYVPIPHPFFLSSSFPPPATLSWLDNQPTKYLWQH